MATCSCIENNLFSGDIDIVTNALDRGANINVIQYIGRTPVHHHACEGRFEIVKLLIERGADVLITDVYGSQDAISGAEYYEHPEIAKYIREVLAKSTQ